MSHIYTTFNARAPPTQCTETSASESPPVAEKEAASDSKSAESHVYERPNFLRTASLRAKSDLFEINRLLELGFTQEQLQYDFNRKFLDLYENIGATPHQQAQREKDKEALFERFENMAKMITNILIQQLEEFPQQPEKWKIQSLLGLGIAGGLKFKVGNLFCKFAKDHKKIYDDDLLAAKMAKNEIRHSKSFLSLRLRNVHTPMCAALTLRGHTVIAQAIVPIATNNETLVYGSSNGLHSIHDKSESVRGDMQQFGHAFGLAPHRLVATDGSSAELIVGFDCEVHESKEDGRAYLLDLGRVMPPNADANPFQWVFVFRPEFMRKRAQAEEPKPLVSSDAALSFASEQERFNLHRAWDDYFTVTIRYLVSVLEGCFHPHGNQSLADVFHAEGVNMRHLIVVYSHPDLSAAKKEILLDEMILRATKCVLRRGSDPTSERIKAELLSKYDLNNVVPPNTTLPWLSNAEYVLVLSEMALTESRLLCWLEPARNIVNSLKIDWVAPPPFLSIDNLEQHYLSEIKLRRNRLTADPKAQRSLLPSLLALLKVYQAWHEVDAKHTMKKAKSLIDEIIKLSTDDATGLSAVGEFYQHIDKDSKALSFHQQALEIRERTLGPDHPLVADSLTSVAEVYESRGPFKKALPLFQRALEIRERALGSDHVDTITALSNLSCINSSLAQFDDALLLAQRAVECSERALGPDHPETANALDTLAGMYNEQARHRDALPLYTRALEIRERTCGPTHRLTGVSCSALAVLYGDLARYQDALPLHQKALDISEYLFGPDHTATASILDNLAMCYDVLSRYSDALPLELRALSIYERVLGPEDPETGLCVYNLASLYESMGRYQDARPWHQRALRISEDTYGSEHPDFATSLSSLASLLSTLGRVDEALPLCLRALEISQKVFGPDHPATSTAQSDVANCLKNLGRYDEALPLYQRDLEVTERSYGADHPETAASLSLLAGLYQTLARYQDALPLYLRALDIRERTLAS